MGRPEYRTVKLTAAEDGREGPADGQEVSVSHAWAWVAMVDGEVLVFDVDDDPGEALAVLARASREDWAEYCEVSPGRFGFEGHLPPLVEGWWPPPPWVRS